MDVAPAAAALICGFHASIARPPPRAIANPPAANARAGSCLPRGARRTISESARTSARTALRTTDNVISTRAQAPTKISMGRTRQRRLNRATTGKAKSAMYSVIAAYGFFVRNAPFESNSQRIPKPTVMTAAAAEMTASRRRSSFLRIHDDGDERDEERILEEAEVGKDLTLAVGDGAASRGDQTAQPEDRKCQERKRDPQPLHDSAHSEAPESRYEDQRHCRLVQLANLFSRQRDRCRWDAQIPQRSAEQNGGGHEKSKHNQINGPDASRSRVAQAVRAAEVGNLPPPNSTDATRPRLERERGRRGAAVQSLGHEALGWRYNDSVTGVASRTPTAQRVPTDAIRFIVMSRARPDRLRHCWAAKSFHTSKASTGAPPSPKACRCDSFVVARWNSGKTTIEYPRLAKSASCHALRCS